MSIPTSLSLNGRIFISLKDHLDALVGTWRSHLFLSKSLVKFHFTVDVLTGTGASDGGN